MFDRFKRLLGLGKKTSVPHATYPTSKAARHAVRKPTRKHPGRDTSAEFIGERYLMFFRGEDVKVYTSDWVDSAQWDEEAEVLTVTFEDGWRQAYPCSQDMAILFADAPSKGGAIHDLWLSKNISGTPA